MKQIEEDKICFYCFGCNRLEDENFNGVRNCKGFLAGKDTRQYYMSLKGVSKNEKESV